MPLTFASKATQLLLICSRSLWKHPWCPCRKATQVTLQGLEKPRQTWTWASRKQQTSLASTWDLQSGASTFCRRKCPTTITHLFFLVLLSGSDLASPDALLHRGSSPSSATKAKNLLQISRWSRNLPSLAKSHKLPVISFSQPNKHKFCLHLLSTAVGSGSKSTDLLLEQLYSVTQIIYEHTSLQTKLPPSPAQGSVKTLGIPYSLRHGELPPLSTEQYEFKPDAVAVPRADRPACCPEAQPPPHAAGPPLTHTPRELHLLIQPSCWASGLPCYCNYLSYNQNA